MHFLAPTLSTQKQLQHNNNTTFAAMLKMGSLKNNKSKFDTTLFCNSNVVFIAAFCRFELAPSYLTVKIFFMNVKCVQDDLI